MRSPANTGNRSLVTAVLLALAWPVVGSAQAPRTTPLDFVGWWEGVDLENHTVALRSIACDKAGDECQVTGANEHFAGCDEHGGGGFLNATGPIEGDFPAVGGWICADGSTTPTVETIFSINRANGTLIESTEENPGTAIGIFHRVSPRVGALVGRSSSLGANPTAVDFIGVWKGVDLEDHTLGLRSITCGDPDMAVCQVYGANEHFPRCDDHGGGGFVDGSGRIEADLPLELHLTCTDGTTFSSDIIYSFDPGNGTLIEGTEENPGTGIFHRVSPRVRRL